MSNRIQIKHGQRAPEASDLAPFELGYDDSYKKLYIGAAEGKEPVLLNPDIKVDEPSLEDFDITVTAEEINKLKGIGENTVAAQLEEVAAQLEEKVPQTRTINGLKLDQDIFLTPAKIGAQPKGDYQPKGNYQPAGDYMETKILFNEAEGRAGTVDLSDSAADFSILEIIVGYADKVICGNAKVVSPNGKVVDISTSTVGNNKYIGMSRTRCTISGNTITQSNNYKASFSGKDDGTVTWALAENNLYIYSVIGYR